MNHAKKLFAINKDTFYEIVTVISQTYDGKMKLTQHLIFCKQYLVNFQIERKSNLKITLFKFGRINFTITY